MKLRILQLLLLLLPLNFYAQVSTVPGDDVMRYYRLAIPVTVSAYEIDFDSDYNRVLLFWQECEDYVNALFVPLGLCFDVVVDERLVMSSRNLIDDDIYNAPSYGTSLTDAAIGSSAYDVGMWVTHRDIYDENTGLSIENGVYSHSTKSSGYAMSDKWVVAHEIGHLFGANHTSQDEGSIMDKGGEFFSYPSIMRIRKALIARASAYYADEERTHLVGVNNGGNYVYGKSVVNSAPTFAPENVNEVYIIPQGACIVLSADAADAEGHSLRYASAGYNSANVGDVSDAQDAPLFATVAPQESSVIRYQPRYVPDLFYDDFYYIVSGTDIPSLDPGDYSVSLLVNDVPNNYTYDYLKDCPFYSKYAVCESVVRVVGGTLFTAAISPAKECYSAGEEVVVSWGVNKGYFTPDDRLRVTMSVNYGESFDYVLAGSVPALDGFCTIQIPNINVGNVDVDFSSAVRSMRGGIIRIEEIGGVSYTQTVLSPENGGGFLVTGGVESSVQDVIVDDSAAVYDLSGRRVVAGRLLPGIYIVDGRKKVVY